jgi:hypothetical protein
MFAFTGRNRFISMESLWRHFKNAKTYIYPYISKISQSIWWPSPFKRTRIEMANGNRPWTEGLVSEEWGGVPAELGGAG